MDPQVNHSPPDVSSGDRVFRSYVNGVGESGGGVPYHVTCIMMHFLDPVYYFSFRRMYRNLWKWPDACSFMFIGVNKKQNRKYVSHKSEFVGFVVRFAADYYGLGRGVVHEGWLLWRIR